MMEDRTTSNLLPGRRDVTRAVRDTFGNRDSDTDPEWLAFEEWERILRRAAVRDPKTGTIGFGGALGVALAARYEWLKESRAAGLTPAQAEARFSARIDSDRKKQAEIENESARLRANAAMQSRAGGRRRGQEADL
jgi:hypothetical protein